MTIFFINILEDRDQPRAIGEIISTSSDRLTRKEDAYPSEGVT
jgi:hypothetical protein